MKKLLYTFLLISPLLFIYSCDKESDSQESQNNQVELSIDDEIYHLNGPAAYIPLGQAYTDSLGYEFHVFLGSNGLQISGDSLIWLDQNSLEYGVGLLIVSSDSTLISSGNYISVSEKATRNEFTANFSITNYSDFINVTDPEFEIIANNDCILNVGYDGADILLEMEDCMDPNNMSNGSFSLYYKGTLTLVE